MAYFTWCVAPFPFHSPARSTRADAVGRGRGTPAIERFLDEATHFAVARAPVPLTLPAHVTLFSGLDPRHHGVHENLAPPLSRGDLPGRLASR